MCTSLEQTKKEIEFTLNLYEDNGHDRKALQTIVDNYEPPTSAKKRQKDHSNVNNKDKKSTNPENSTKDLFRALPFRSEEDVREEEEEEMEE